MSTPRAALSPAAAAPVALSPTALAGLSSELRLACMRISRRVRFESDAPIPPHQFSVLVRLEERPRTPRELAEVERVSAPSMTRTANTLVGKGLVARTDDPLDRRSVILSLTPEGLGTIKAIRRARDRWMYERLRGLTPEEQGTLTRAAEILHRVAEK